MKQVLDLNLSGMLANLLVFSILLLSCKPTSSDASFGLLALQGGESGNEVNSLSFSAVTTLAGPTTGPGALDGTGTAASFNEPRSIVSSGGNLYVADSTNHIIRRIEISTGAVTTLAGTAGRSGSVDGTGSAARFSNPDGITTDGTNLYVVDRSNHTIRKVVISTGVVTTLAGTAGNSGSTDGTGILAKFKLPAGITMDATNLYVTDSSNHTVRKIVISTGVVTTLAGTAGSQGSADGTGAAARFMNPAGITTDGTNLYLADNGNHVVRKIVIATGEVTTLVGTAGSHGSADGTGAAARFANLAGVTTDGINLYVADSANHTVRKVVISTGVVTTLAGTAGGSGAADGTGSTARFAYPLGIAIEGTNLYIADTGNHSIRKVVISTGAVTAFAGTAESMGSSDGPGASARFRLPYGITMYGRHLYVADSGNYTIRKITIATGAVTTLAGTAGSAGYTDGTGTAAEFGAPWGITTDGTNLYVADMYGNTIRKIVIATGVVTTLAGTAGSPGYADGTGTAAKFYYPMGITTDGTNLYVADSGYSLIRKVVIATGAVTTLAGLGGEFATPTAITTDGTNLYVADTGNHRICRIVISTGEVTTIAGMTDSPGSVDGVGTAAMFNGPLGITTDGTNLYVADGYNHMIRQIEISTGAVTTLAGTTLPGTTDGSLSSARFNEPAGIVYGSGALFVTGVKNHNVRKID